MVGSEQLPECDLNRGGAGSADRLEAQESEKSMSTQPQDSGVQSSLVMPDFDKNIRSHVFWNLVFPLWVGAGIACVVLRVNPLKLAIKSWDFR